MNPSLKALSLLVLCLLQAQVCSGQSQLIGSSQPIVATVGDDVILPCLSNPARDVSGLTLEWTRPDLDPRFVFVWRSSDELTELKHPQYTGRTVVFTDELKHGNISLKLRKVQPSDEGTYRCFIPTMGVETSVRLNVVVTSSCAQVSVAAVDGWRAAVVLQCESRGWYPEPELLWLDSEGRPLSADPTQTHRRPDGLYNVSSRVTVEQSHGSTFTCRVSESSTNQSTHTSLQVSHDLFRVNFSPVIISLAAGLVLFVVVSVVLLILFIWKTKHPTDVQPRREQFMKFKLNKAVETEWGPRPTLQDQTNRIKQEHHTFLTQGETTTEVKELTLENKELTLKNKVLKTNLEKTKMLQEKRRLREITENTSKVIVDKVDPWGRYVTLRNKTLKEVENLKDWRIQIEVDDSEPLVYKFERDLTLRAENTVAVWAKGSRTTREDSLKDKEWEKQGPWNTGQTAVVSLYNNNNELMDRIYQEIHRDQKQTTNLL